MARQCGHCGHEKTRVIDSQYRAGSNTIRRRRACPACGHRYTTHEHIAARRTVKKRNGALEPLDDSKLLKSLALACSGLPAASRLTDIAGAAVREGFAGNKTRITSEELRDGVMGQLKRLEPVAYVRYRLSECRDLADMVVILAEFMVKGTEVQGH